MPSITVFSKKREAELPLQMSPVRQKDNSLEQ